MYTIINDLSSQRLVSQSLIQQFVTTHCARAHWRYWGSNEKDEDEWTPLTP